MARKSLTPAQRELISIRTKEAMSAPEVREKIRAGARAAITPELRELISRRTREAMSFPEVRQRISANTKAGMAARAAEVEPELAALQCAWRNARPEARRRFLDEVFAKLTDEARS